MWSCIPLMVLSLTALCLGAEHKTLVVMRVFSSMRNPEWYVDGASREELLRLVKPLYGKEEHSCNREGNNLGYTGFNIIDSSDNKCVYVVNSVEAESYLLGTYVMTKTRENEDANKINTLVEHVKTVMTVGVNTVAVKESPVYPAANEIIRGPDNVTRYSPERWNDILTALRNNNCYNYGTDVRTDSFAQPGVGSGRSFKTLDCSEVWEASIRDGLTPLESKKCPEKEQPEVGHYVTLVVWPFMDFHWYRKDLGGYWSHKPGSTRVKDVDASQNKILNPDKANIKPYTEICGYYVVVPSKITIK
ncbi:insoluble matrix shell protein [Acrasis kona]|uniref:Insoluble matrix shell protein n=1 Tax=Acrasis kona TaxID=1008807 RepID=A0AAW2ZMH9_9EUKA